MKQLQSIFTKNMNKCLVTSAMIGVERHHIFGGPDRAKSEKYNFIVPLHNTVHPNGANCQDKNWTELDHWLRRKCQEYYIEVAHFGTRADWYREFGRFYDDRADENIGINRTFEWRL